MRLSALLDQAHATLQPFMATCPPRSDSETATKPPPVLYFSVSNGRERAHVVTGRGLTFKQAWGIGARVLTQWVNDNAMQVRWLRVDATEHMETVTWATLKTRFEGTKTNYFKQGIAWDADFQVAALEQELAGHACLYTGDIEKCTPNEINLRRYMKKRFKRDLGWPEDDDQRLWLFTTRAVFVDVNGAREIEHNGLTAGIRKLDDLAPDAILEAVHRSADYLARQVKPDGMWHYGWYPCFDRLVPSYNTLRHASSAYSLMEGWELTQRPEHMAAVERALSRLASDLIKPSRLPDGTEAFFLVDQGNEIKLGGNAVCLLAFAKHATLTGRNDHLPLMRGLAEGILHMQDKKSGRFVHVLNFPGLDLKEETRTVYYDGEAAFGLMRLFELTGETRWLDAVERGIQHFIKAKHWKAHDHWLGYCINEFTKHRPEERYFQFGLDNVKGHLDFVLKRITTYPTLLELMMAAQRMIARMRQDPQWAALVDKNLSQEKFDQALHHRARYLFNGYFYPELAMFFAAPDKMLHSFFIRHFSFRVRIDDVQHYLSGLVAYWRMRTGLEQPQQEISA